MSKRGRFLATGLVLGGLAGIVVGAAMHNTVAGIIFGSGGGLLIGLAMSAFRGGRA